MLGPHERSLLETWRWKQEKKQTNPTPYTYTQSIAQHHFDEVETTDRKHIPSMYSIMSRPNEAYRRTATLPTDREENRKTRHVQIVIIVFGFFFLLFFFLSFFSLGACSLHVARSVHPFRSLSARDILVNRECLGQTRGAQCNMPNSSVSSGPSDFGFISISCIELRFN